MPQTFQVTFDCRDVDSMTRFWALAMEYIVQPPPDGYASWADFGTEHGIPREQWPGALVDPTGNGPRLFFQPVPEAKTAKSRVHLDINAGSGATTSEMRRELALAHAKRCEEAGGKILRIIDEGFDWHVAMLDPEGNEFCVQ